MQKFYYFRKVILAVTKGYRLRDQNMTGPGVSRT